MALFWLRTSYHAQRYMFQPYMLRSLLTQSFNIVNTPIILLFSKKWVPGFAAEDNRREVYALDHNLCTASLHLNCRQKHFLNMYDAYPGDGAEGLPREWITTTVGDTQPYINWKGNQPNRYAFGYTDGKLKWMGSQDPKC